MILLFKLPCLRKGGRAPNQYCRGSTTPQWAKRAALHTNGTPSSARSRVPISTSTTNALPNNVLLQPQRSSGSSSWRAAHTCAATPDPSWRSHELLLSVAPTADFCPALVRWPNRCRWTSPTAPGPGTLLPAYRCESVWAHLGSIRKPSPSPGPLQDASSTTVLRVVVLLPAVAPDPADRSSCSARPTTLASPGVAPWPRATNAKPSTRTVRFESIPAV